MQPRFVLIGLAGVGKSTLLKRFAEYMSSKAIHCEVKLSDEIIHKRFVENDPIILKFQDEKKIKITKEIFSADKPTGAFIKEFGEEPLFRDLEEMFIKDILQSGKPDDWYDLGGKAPLRDGATISLHENKLIPIFLYAEHETILARLELDDNWQKRSNYLQAGENGWRALAATHREERLKKYVNAATIVISVDAKDKVTPGVDGPQLYILKTPDDLLREIRYRIKELELTCINRNNAFSNKSATFFSSSVRENVPSVNSNEIVVTLTR